MRAAALLFVFILCPSTFAESIYQSTAKDGSIIFSDKPIKQAQQQKQITIDPSIKRDEEKEVKQFEATLAKASGLSNQSSKKQRLQLAIKNAELELKEAQIIFNSALKRQNKAFEKCKQQKAALEKSNKTSYYVCQHTSLKPFEMKILHAKQKLAKLRANRMP